MALDNIRERLMLFYDLEATLDTERGEGLVRFILTRQGIELFDAREAATRRIPELMN